MMSALKSTSKIVFVAPQRYDTTTVGVISSILGCSGSTTPLSDENVVIRRRLWIPFLRGLAGVSEPSAAAGRDLNMKHRLDERADDASVRSKATHDVHSVAPVVLGMWGANTDVGKTLVSAALATRGLRKMDHVSYVKPVQTGYPMHSDELFVRQIADNWDKNTKHDSRLDTCTLHAWKEAVSPHLAAEMELSPAAALVSDDEILQSIKGIFKSIDALCQNKKRCMVLLETAGGPGSPGPNGSLQCDMLRPLRYQQVVLVGDGKLGGISGTLAAYEMMKSRGYSVSMIPILENQGKSLENYKIIQKYVDSSETLVLPLTPCGPPPDGVAMSDEVFSIDPNLKSWLNKNIQTFDAMIDHASENHKQFVEDLRSAGEKASSSVWWPFTQHASIKPNDITVIESRCGEEIVAYQNGKLEHLYDGCASWWTQGMDEHNVPGMASAISHAVGRYGHVIFPKNINNLALEVTERMLELVGSGWASRVFFSDNGSTAVEVALKMAFRKYMTDHGILDEESIKLDILGVHGAYHGDTLGTMDAVAPSVFNGRLQTPWFTGRGAFLHPPLTYIADGEWVLDFNENFNLKQMVEKCDGDKIRAYEAYIRDAMGMHKTRIGACIIEPVIQGAGGMRFIDPDFHKAMSSVCKDMQIPVIADEVFTGIWRLGAPSACQSILGISPDIGCYAKLFTGGVVPMSVTLASEEVFESFSGMLKQSYT